MNENFKKEEIIIEENQYRENLNNKKNKNKKNNNIKIFLIISILVISSLLFVLIWCLRSINLENLNIQIPKISSNSENNNNDNLNNNISNNNNPTIEIKKEPEIEGQLTAEEIYKNLSPSVVGIVVYDPTADIISDPVGQGSGIIISESGYIVTNSHVVGDSKKKYNIKVVLTDQTEFPATVVGFDTRTDVAVIKAQKTGLVPAKFGDSDQVKVGSWALALGNPVGLNFASSLTRGIISAVNRSMGSAQSLVKYIQTDAAINPGNSGGALINMHGQVIGINSVKIALTSVEGMGFAIPINTAKTVVDDIISKGYVSGRARLGMTGKMVSYYQSQIYNVPIGVIIADITQDSDLKSQNIQIGDIITKINDVNITGLEVLYGELSKYTVGQTVKLNIHRVSSNRINSTNFDANVKLLEDKGENTNN